MGFLRKLFRKKGLAPEEAAAEMIARHLRDDGSETHVKGNVFFSERLGFACECRVFPTQGAVQYQLDVATWLDPDAGLAIVESSACWGETVPEAISNGVHKWLLNVHPVLESGLAGIEVEGVERHTLLLREAGADEPVAWTAHVGSVLFGMTGELTTEDLPMFACVAPAFETLEAGGDVAWLRTFVGGPPDMLIYECLLINDTWADGEAALRTMQWPDDPALLSARQFALLRRDAAS